MIKTSIVLTISFGYLCLLFAIAYYGDKRADENRSIISNPYIYALSLAVYCTAWTFYGSVGFAARSGLGFLPIYLGPTLMASLGWLVLRKIIRISKIHRITTISDFIASRYGKSMTMGAIVAIIAVLGVIPYISLQLKAISSSLLILTKSLPVQHAHIPVFTDTAFYATIILAIFAILFGTRHLDATERHEGMVAAIAFESIVKLSAFLAVGVFVTFFIYDGFGDLAARANENEGLRRLFTMDTEAGALAYADWSIYLFLSMTAVLFLPRQFQVAVVENVNEDHLNKAIWLFPLYLLAINIFVLPVAFGGALHFVGQDMDADFFALTMPMIENQKWLALFVFIGGTSAATGMVIVETIALSTMICNELVMPTLLRLPIRRLTQRKDFSGFILATRRGGIVLVLLLGYAYFRYVGEFYSLVSIGLMSFSAIAQFTPSILGGIFWKSGTRSGALSGLVAGFLVWGYTLMLPSLCQAGILPETFVTQGPWGIELLKPLHLFGLQGFNHISHAVFWSMLLNLSMYIGVSMFSVQSAIEHSQANLFVDVFKFSEQSQESHIWRGTAFVPDLRSLLGAVLGKSRANDVIATYAKRNKINMNQRLKADPGMVSYAEKILAGTIGSASAHVMVSSVVKEEPLAIQDVMKILDETRQAIAYSRDLEKATAELKAANEQLKALDNLKDEFISTVTHELRTPLTSVRSLAGILHDNPDLEVEQRNRFSGIIIQEGERLTRLINQVLDFQKIESGSIAMQIAPVDLKEVIQDALTSTRQLIGENRIQVRLDLSGNVPTIQGDKDRLIQVMLNLISNAVKFCNQENGIIQIELFSYKNQARINVTDNGEGISRENLDVVFERFWQVRNNTKGRPTGSGLGLAIAKQIIDRHYGKIWVESQLGQGATFSLTLPLT